MIFRRNALILFALFLIWNIFLGTPSGWTQAANYQRIVILSDTHLPVIPRPGANSEQVERIKSAKQKVIMDINAWEDVSGIVVTGDLVASFGTDEEYADAKTYFNQLNKPVSYIVGNHDYIYAGRTADGEFIRGNADERRNKLERFKREFNQQQLYYTQELGRYLLIFLSVDSLDSKVLCEISPEQLAWFDQVLSSHQDSPTIVFFHAPLAGTLENYNRYVNKPSFVAQPEDKLQALLQKNPQVLMWVSGHTHTPATNMSFAAPINLYDGRIHDIHNANLDQTPIWTNLLYLYPDKVIVKTFQHRDGIWLDQLERVFTLK